MSVTYARITDLTAAGPVQDGDLFETDQGGSSSVKQLASSLAAYVIAKVTPNTRPNGLVSGGVVAWQSAFTFRMSAAIYYINGLMYTAAEQTITLDAADATLDRIDILAVDATGTLVKITGTAAAQPSQPNIDPSTQLQLTFILVVHNTTAPVGAADEIIYADGVEWTPATAGTGINPASTNNPRTGTKCIEGTAVTAASYVKLTRASAILSQNYDILAFFVRSKATWGTKGLTLRFYNGNVALGAAVNLQNNTWGFLSTQVSSYQFVAIPMSQFQLPANTAFDGLRFTDFGGAIGFYLDDISLKSSGSSGTQNNNSYITLTDADARYQQLVNVQASMTASEAISAAQFVNIFASSGAKVRKANATDNTKPATGFAPLAIASGAAGLVIMPGQIVSGLTGLTPGSEYFLDTTGGGITVTPPSADGNLVQYVGVAISATQLMFNPERGVSL